MEQKRRVVISRHWHKPGINVTFHVGGIDSFVSVDLPAEDFIAALASELEAIPRWKRLIGADVLQTAIRAVLEKMKLATAGVSAYDDRRPG